MKINPILRRPAWFFSVAVTSVLLSSVFQNCGLSPLNSATVMSSLDLNHPSEVELTGNAGYRVQLADKDYIKSYLTDILLDDQSPATDRTFFDASYDYEKGLLQSNLGRSCTNITQGTGTDCNYNDGNFRNGFYSAPSVGREGSRFQICRRLLYADSIVMGVLRKLPARTSTPNAKSVDAVIRLFYPDTEDDSPIQASLLRLDEQMSSGNERVVDRWRMILLTLCESPGWQVLSE